MKEFICKKDYYIEDVKYAQVGDHILLLPDNTTVVNTNGHKVERLPDIIKDIEYFTPTFETCSTSNVKVDMVNHPSHYTWLKEKCGIEVIDITRHLDFCIGNAVKYLLRAGYKTEEGYSTIQKTVEDLQKAIFYINDKINTIQYDRT